MVRLCLGMALTFAVAQAQNGAKASLEEELGNLNQLLERGRTAEAERLLRQWIPKPEDEPVQDSGVFSSTSLQDGLWALVGYSYLGANDYSNAERVAGERLHAVEVKGSAAAGHVAVFLTLLVEVDRLESKHAAAYPL